MSNKIKRYGIILLVSVSFCSIKEDHDNIQPQLPDLTPVGRAFQKNAIEKTVLHSSGETWSIDWLAEGSEHTVLKGTTSSWYFYSAISETQGIYVFARGDHGSRNKYIGVGIEGDKAFIYQQGTILPWSSEKEVSFDQKFKVESSAKGEFVSKATGILFLDNKQLELKTDGNIYEGNILLYIHNKTDEETKTQSVYQKSLMTESKTGEFMGISVEEVSGRNMVFFYRPNKGTQYFTSVDTVSFDLEHRFSPKDDFVVAVEGTYESFDYISDKIVKKTYIIKDDANIYEGSEVVYRFVGIDMRYKAVYSFGEKFIGFEFVEGSPNKMFLYKDGMELLWDEFEDVEFDKNHRITDLGFFLKELPIAETEIPIGDHFYRIKETGKFVKMQGSSELSTGGFGFVRNFSDVDGIKKNQSIYTNDQNKFVGIGVLPIARTVYLYQENRISPWTSITDVSFDNAHRVESSDTWNPIGVGLNTGIVHWTSSVIDNKGNVYIAFQDGVNGSVMRYDINSNQWIRIFDKKVAHRIGGNRMAIDNDDNLYWVYLATGSGNKLGVLKYTPGKTDGNINDAQGWETLGDLPNSSFVNGVGIGKYPYPLIHNDVLYVLAAYNNTQPIVMRYDPNGEEGSKWVQVGNNDSEAGAGSKSLLVDSNNNFYIVANSSNLNSSNMKIYRLKNGENEWKPFGTPTGLIAQAQDVSAIILNNIIYVAYHSGGKSHIKKWNINSGVTWESVGTSINYPGEYIAISSYSDNQLIVITSGDGGVNQPIRVHTFNGTDWVKVGRDVQVSSGDAFYTGLSVDRARNIVYASFTDRNDSDKLGVRAYTRVTTVR